jgi:hypothetical protein
VFHPRKNKTSDSIDQKIFHSLYCGPTIRLRSSVEPSINGFNLFLCQFRSIVLTMKIIGTTKQKLELFFIYRGGLKLWDGCPMPLIYAQ